MSALKINLIITNDFGLTGKKELSWIIRLQIKAAITLICINNEALTL